MEKEERDKLPATLRQIGFLYVLGQRNIAADLTVGDASKKISELLAEQNGESE